jgi:hypothetical protein
MYVELLIRVLTIIHSLLNNYYCNVKTDKEFTRDIRILERSGRFMYEGFAYVTTTLAQRLSEIIIFTFRFPFSLFFFWKLSVIHKYNISI